MTPTTRQLAFLEAVLGEDGAAAVLRAIKKSEPLLAALVPRAVLAWSELACAYGYVGEVPGVPQTLLEFRKAEQGFTGALTVGDDTVQFDNTSVFGLAAHVAVVLGDLPPVTDSPDLGRLGKSLDLLVKARAVRSHRKAVEKADLPGTTAKPQAQGAPIEPVAPTKQPKVRKPPKTLPTLRVVKSEMGVRCGICGCPQFSSGVFTGCLCLAELAKSAKSTSAPGGVTLSFGSGWSMDAVTTLVRALRGR